MTLKQFSQLTKDQHSAISFIESHETGGLWADVGTGKTVSALTAVLRLLNRFDCKRVLVVGPRLVAERVWESEVAEWEHLKHLRVSKIVGTAAQRLAAMERDADVYTITRDNVCWLEDQFIRYEGLIKAQYRKWPWDTVILDESQSFKSQSSQRFKSIRRLRRLFPRCYLLSGSLMPNGYGDLWSQLYLIDGGERLGKTESAYHQRWFSKEVNDGVVRWTLKPHAAEEIDARISDVFYVMRDAQPPAPTNFIKVSLSKEERATYSKMVRTSVLQLGDQEVTAVNAGVLWGKLLQMANGAVYDEKHEWHEIHSRKLEALWELLESLPRPVIIGYGFVHDVERIFKYAPKSLGRMGILRTSKSLDEWRQGKIDIGIMHPASAGHGLNDLYLSGAENLVWYGFTSNREFYDQLNGRLTGGHRRTGRNVCIHHIVAEGTVDEDAQTLLNFKGDQQVTAQIRVAQKMKEQIGCLTTSRTGYSKEASKTPASPCPSANQLLSTES
jgi:SNF2 family DNA or RNA helicase